MVKEGRYHPDLVSKSRITVSTLTIADALSARRGKVWSMGCKSAPDNAQGSGKRQGKIDSNEPPDGGPGHQREQREEWMNLEFVAHDPWCDPIVHQHSPQAEKNRHPDPVGVSESPDADDCRCGNHPARNGNEFQDS